MRVGLAKDFPISKGNTPKDKNTTIASDYFANRVPLHEVCALQKPATIQV